MAPHFSHITSRPSRYSLVEPLTAEEVGGLRLPRDSFFDHATLAQHAATWPRLAWRAGSEYVVGGYWRGRPDIGMLVELGAYRHRRALLDRLLRQFQEEGCEAVVLSDQEASRDLGWYTGSGWLRLEEIRIFELRDCRQPPVVPLTLEVRPFSPSDLEQFLAVERASFPWLWWKSGDEFLHYAVEPDVEVFGGHVDGEMAGYVSYTVRGSRGHLDRLAVHERFQGQGYGAQLLSFALRRLADCGVRSVALTTQIDNLRSQRLYRRFGFRPSEQGYSIYGRILREGDLERCGF